MARGEFAQDELVPLPPQAAGLCGLCFQPSGQWPNCYSCNECLKAVVSREISLMPIALRIAGSPLAHATWNYKDHADPTIRDEARHQLAWLLHHFMPRHERCLASACADLKTGTAFDVICPIPSSKHRAGRHPLVDLLESVPWSQDRMQDVLQPGTEIETHQPSEEKFTVDTMVVRGRSVLVVDDTMTRGANLVSAVNTVRSSGATAVAAMVIGRHFVPSFSTETADYAAHAESVPFTFTACVYCDERPVSKYSITGSA